ncbi:MAG: NAD(P)-binding domain-containing protein [Chthoniobacterales bacterium]
MNERPRVAVVGAGAAGLVSAREARREGLDVVVYEASDRVGGVWVYREEVGADPAGQRPGGRPHGSLYSSLRTNLPKEVMAFRDFPFEGGRQFPEHARVLAYLERFATEFGVVRQIRFKTPVEQVMPKPDGGWLVRTAAGEDTFDAVMVCNGHYSRPRLPDLPGTGDFPSQMLHSRNYRHPEPFAGKRVVVIGSGASGTDLAGEIGRVASRVWWCATSFASEGGPGFDPVQRKALPRIFLEDGSVELEDGERLDAVDAVVFCTGYYYSIPFVPKDVVTSDGTRVEPLYHELVPPRHSTMALVGLPLKIIPFPLFETQAQWFVRRVSGRWSFPSRAEMEAAIADRQRHRTAAGRDGRHHHVMGDDQFDYVNRLAAECGADPLPDWFERMARAARASRLRSPESYRDIPISPEG